MRYTAVLFLWFSLLQSLPANAPRVIGRITAIKGDADIVELETRESKKARLGMPLYDTEQLRTGLKSKVLVSLIDSSRLEIFEFSVVNVKLLDNKEQDPMIIPIAVRMLSGKLRMKVQKVIYAEKKFFLKTPTLVAAVRGTDFSCVATLLDARLAVAEGLVEVANRSPSLKNSYVLTARQEIRVREGREPEGIRFLTHDLLENYLDNYEITRSQQIRKRVREPDTFLDLLLKKKDY